MKSHYFFSCILASFKLLNPSRNQAQEEDEE